MQAANWNEFREAGMLWWINRILHVFGWAIVCQVEEDGTTSCVCPVRVDFRGFSRGDEVEGHKLVSHWMAQHSAELEREAADD